MKQIKPNSECIVNRIKLIDKFDNRVNNTVVKIITSILLVIFLNFIPFIVSIIRGVDSYSYIGDAIYICLISSPIAFFAAYYLWNKRTFRFTILTISVITILMISYILFS